MVNRVFALLVPLLVIASFSAAASAGSLGVIISQQRAVMDAGQNSIVSANVTGGTGNYTCNWSWYTLSGPNSGSIAGQNCTITFYGNSSDLASPDVVQVNVNDSAGDNGYGLTFIAVKPMLSFTMTPLNATIYFGDSVLFSNITSGGFGVYSYQYVVNPALGVNETGNLFTFANVGVYNVTETVNDTNGASASATAQITVLPVTTTSTTTTSTTTSTESTTSSSSTTSIPSTTSISSTSTSTSVSTTSSSTSIPSTTSTIPTTTSTSTSTSTTTSTSSSTVSTTTVNPTPLYYVCSKGPTTNITVTDSNYQQYKSLSYSKSGISVNVNKVTNKPISVSTSGSYDCLSINSVGGGDINLATSGSYESQHVYSNVSGSLTVGLSGSYSVLGFNLGSGTHSLSVSGSYETINLTTLGGKVSDAFSGSYELMNLKTVKSGTMTFSSSGSHSTVNSIGGTVTSGVYTGSYNMLGFTNEAVTSITCTSGSHDVITLRNATIVTNRC